MTNIINVFENKLIKKELTQSRKHGVKVVVPIRSFILSEPEKESSPYVLPSALKQFYDELNSMLISWSISKKNQQTIAIFKENQWLIDNYLSKGYQWEVVEEYLSGYINITKSEDIFNPDFCKNQAYYYTLSNLDVNQDDYFPFDIHFSLTACLKKENGKIVDNI